MSLKYSEKTTITVSEDQSTVPNNIRFQDTQNDIDVVALTQIEDVFASFASGSTNAINMGSITQAKFLWIKPAADIQLMINGSVTPLVIKAGKASKIWTLITSLSVVIPVQTPSNPVAVTIVIAG